MIIALSVLAIIMTIVAMGSIVINLLLLRACQKMYTEYFKDRSMGNRSTGGTDERM